MEAFRCTQCGHGWAVEITTGPTEHGGENFPTNWPQECPACGSDYFRWERGHQMSKSA